MSLSLTALGALASGIAILILGWLGSAYFGANFRQLAADRGWDKHFVRVWVFVEMLAKQSLRDKWWLWLCLGLSGGLGSALLLLSPPLLPKQSSLDLYDKYTWEHLGDDEALSLRVAWLIPLTQVTATMGLAADSKAAEDAFRIICTESQCRALALDFISVLISCVAERIHYT